MAAARTGETPTPPLPSETGRSSPPPSCVICLGPFKNRSFTENCLHQFCFDCLVRWSKIKAECPLCKQPFKSIIHSVRSNSLYDKYDVPPTSTSDALDMTTEINMLARRFRYRTTLTLHPRDNYAIRNLLLGYPTDSLPVDNIYERYRSTPSTFSSYATLLRRSMYSRNFWANPLPDVTGRFRECSPEFYRNNPAQIHRLVPWLTRELISLRLESSIIAYTVNQITELITLRPIKSRAFRNFIASIIPPHEAEHFIHEFYSFATSPYDMVGYDGSVTYRVGGPYIVDNIVNEISSSEDSDVYVVTSETGTSSLVNNPHNSGCLGDPIVIESISHSDTDDSSEGVLMIVDKKPEIVDLVGSDSDAVIVEERKPHFPTRATSAEPSLNLPSTSGLSNPNLKRKSEKPIFLSDTDSNNSLVSAKKVRMKSNIFRRRKNMKCTCNSTDDSDHDSDSSRSSSSSSSTSSFSRAESVQSKSIDNQSDAVQNSLHGKTSRFAHSRDKRENVSLDLSSNRIKRGRSSSVDSQYSNVNKKSKRKKLKRKKSKKKSEISKRKHKRKQKKRSKSKDKSYLNSTSKGKFCSKSKIKNRIDSSSSDDSSDGSKSKPCRPRESEENVNGATSTDIKRKTLKSVVNSAKNCDNKKNLLDLLSHAVLSSNNPILSINNKYSHCSNETSRHENYSSGTSRDIDDYIEDSKVHFTTTRNIDGEPLDLRKKDDTANHS